jgi:acyl carrier protein
MTDTQTLVFTIIANTLGVDITDVTLDSDFTLDLNATPDDLRTIKLEIENNFEIVLPESEDEEVTTVGSLMEVVEDSLL